MDTKMIRHIILTPALSFVVFLILSCSASSSTSENVIIPVPTKVKYTGSYNRAPLASTYEEFLSYAHLKIDSSRFKAESYHLNISPRKISLEAGDSSGLFYAYQTYMQLIDDNGVKTVDIYDEPRFLYRGVHLDVSRHFIPKDRVKKILVELSRYKINKFHFHLTDNGGWRVYINKYPELTQKGAYRTKSLWVEWWDKMDRRYIDANCLPEGIYINAEGAYGGYYTQEDIREIVSFADSLHIEVIPEIELPAHSNEVFAAYPELCCGGKAYSGGEFCISQPKTYEFLANVFDEIIELFPSKYFHIGADEARKKEWAVCPKCQKFLSQMNSQNLEDLQSYIVNWAIDYLSAKGKIVMGWDEILNANSEKDIVAFSYRGHHTLMEAVEKGKDVVFTPGAAWYLDWYQANPEYEPRAMIGYSPLKKCYSIFPMPDDSLKAKRNTELILSQEFVGKDLKWVKNSQEASHIIGVQACAWTEFMDDADQVEYMLFPRVLAIAELGWSCEESRNWEDFKRRVSIHLPLIRARGFNAYHMNNDIEITSSIGDDGVHVHFDSEVYGAEYHYEIVNHIDDDRLGRADADSLVIPFDKFNTDSLLVRAVAYKDRKVVSRVTQRWVYKNKDRREYYEYVQPSHWKKF